MSCDRNKKNNPKLVLDVFFFFAVFIFKHNCYLKRRKKKLKYIVIHYTMRFWFVLAFILILSVVEIFADLSLAEWANTQRFLNQHWGLVAGVGIYAIVGVLYGISLVYGKLSIANTIWQIMSIVIVFWIGVYMYKERPSIGQWIGVSVIILGMAVIVLAEKDVWTTTHPIWHKPWSPFATKTKALVPP